MSKTAQPDQQDDHAGTHRQILCHDRVQPAFTARLIALDNMPRSWMQLFSRLLHFQRSSEELENQKTTKQQK
jgi:hypothetical protein